MSTETLYAPLSRMRPVEGLDGEALRRRPDGSLDLDAYLRAGRERRRRRALVASMARRIAKSARPEGPGLPGALTAAGA